MFSQYIIDFCSAFLNVFSCPIKRNAYPTNAKVVMLMRTSGRKTDLSALKHSPRVLPVVKTSSTSRMCFGHVNRLESSRDPKP